MKISCRQHWVLWRTGRSLCRSDPHLAAMLVIFARLTAGEAIPSRERTAPAGGRPRRGPAWLWRAMSAVAAYARWVLRRAAWACATVRWRFSRAPVPRRASRPTAGNSA